MIGAAIVGFVAGVIGRALMPGDPFHDMNGPRSWGISIVGAVIGVFIVLAIVGAVMKNRGGAAGGPRPTAP
jgi:uncharacterized membrane protein YeaQ/YmgE (transglycosylase-associated protein family)